MSAQDFLPEWGPVDEEEQAAKEAERLERKVSALFGALGSPENQKGKVQQRRRTRPSGS